MVGSAADVPSVAKIGRQSVVSFAPLPPEGATVALVDDIVSKSISEYYVTAWSTCAHRQQRNVICEQYRERRETNGHSVASSYTKYTKRNLALMVALLRLGSVWSGDNLSVRPIPFLPQQIDDLFYAVK